MEGVEEKAKIRQWVEAWRAAAPVLAEIRRQDILEADNRIALAQMAPAFALALRMHPARESSGLVEMQRYFRRLR